MTDEARKQFQMFVPNDDGSAMDWLENTIDIALQAERERLVSKIKFKDCPHDSSAHCWEEDCRIHDVGGYNEAVNDILNLINPPSN